MAEELASCPTAAAPSLTFTQRTHAAISYLHIVLHTQLHMCFHKSHTHSDDTPIPALTDMHANNLMRAHTHTHTHTITYFAMYNAHFSTRIF